MNNCEICPILATHNNNKDVQIIQTEKWRVVLDPNQSYLGKSFVTLLDHKSSLSDLDEEDWKDFKTLVGRLENGMRKAFQPNHFNWSCLMNIAAMNGQETHVHWHVCPRYDRPVTIANQTFEDTQWYPREDNPNHVVDRVVLQIIADNVREYL